MGRKMFQLKGFDTVFFMSHMLFLLVCYSIYLAPHIAPSTFPYLGIIPIVYPILIFLNLLMIFILFWRRTSYAILFLLMSIGLYFPLNKTYQFFGKTPNLESNFKIITWNAQYLREPGANEFFAKEQPDVLIMQEVYTKNEGFKELKSEVFSTYYHENNQLTQIFSKYPIIEFQQILSAENNNVACAFYADLDVEDDTIRIVNVYLESMFIDKKLVQQSVENFEQTEEKSKIIGGKLAKGFLLHEKQLKQILPFVQRSKHPVIFGGDLNAVPNSYEYQQISYYLNDAFYAVGKGSGTSFHDFNYPMRLDYLFHSEEIQPVKVEVKKDQKLSDHYPIIGHFKLP
ncbi:endonuclease/exonuclease/phosphatase family protein [Moheibacter stercoris]|uniref:Exonuclease III n=1 Tax=Moheibacter stercoris TaxID=1628251 RepID=A0ABV2LQ39_9FLAO